MHLSVAPPLRYWIISVKLIRFGIGWTCAQVEAVGTNEALEQLVQT